jgi:hypothetical protein
MAMTNNLINHAAARIASGTREAETPHASSAMPAAFVEVRQDVDEAAVRQLFRAANAVSAPEPELSGTGFTYRHNWGPRRGQLVLRLNWSVINPRSRVLVAIGEGVAGGPDAGKFVGAARFTVHNVAPRTGGVDIWVNIEWGADLSLYVDYLIVNV